MSIQLLAQALVRREMFPHASQKALRWRFRKQNLLEEFLAFAPDLACLQEVDFWEECYHPALTKAGYDTVYYKNINKKHGCAIIWRKSRFEKVDQLALEYDDIGQPTFRTGNIGLMVGLKPLQHKAENPDPNADMLLTEDEEDQDKEENTIRINEAEDDNEETNIPGGILVVTTHLFWRPDGSYERLRQASILLDKIKEWNQQLKFTVLLGGDFNTTPRDAAYRAMTRNQMPPQQIPNLEQWLVNEVVRVQEETKAQAAALATTMAGFNGEVKSEVKTEQDAEAVRQLVEQTQNLELGETLHGITNAEVTEDGKQKASDLPYRSPPTGIILPKLADIKTTSRPSTPSAAGDTSAVVDVSEFLSSEDPKIKKLATLGESGGEDTHVVAPLEAFTPPRELLATIESHARCISIYGQYEALTKHDPAEIDEAAVAKAAEEESTATKAHVQHTHGEPVFTNYATWFKDTLDYVYLYDEYVPENGACLVPLKLLEIPDKSHLGHGLPNENFSSDHLCLVVEFAFLPRLPRQ
ncbi:hypothetical protein BGZ65_006198 [Modicella reniformis]|uniref:Endonuclease/exonuclease/phosphatase domain-containing protein n=1 Tax=Modicella reniformis TaxID=1440133 RepID=A0A9P6IKD4_9FUNG|nr:hypothetical protein BGZ65_006198 [Modicella reniformis]